MTMPSNMLLYFTLLAPLAFLLVAVLSWFQPGLRPKMVIKAGWISSLLGILISLSSIWLILKSGLVESALLGFEGIGFSIRLDAVSVLMFTMINILSFIILKFSTNYLDGDSRQGAFIGRLSATIASVQLLVLSGNLGLLLFSWILTSLSLHRLLIFYSNRPGAIIAARKKFIFARLSDLFLAIAVLLIYLTYGTGNLEAIFTFVKNGFISPQIELAGVFLALAALFKSAQFPTHGWLIEVMETPTPVSALLHAGLLNAGPYLIIRMAFIMDACTYAPAILIIVGGLTALFASVVFMTQTSIKTSLGFSSVAHMGFSLMVCGLGAYPAALLHLVSHSFYKAHAFLSSGSIIDIIRANKYSKLVRLGNPMRIVLGVIIPIVIFFGMAQLFGIALDENWGIALVGCVIVLGLIKIMISALDTEFNGHIIIQSMAYCVIISAAFFSLESLSHIAIESQIPTALIISTEKLILFISVLVVFTAVVFIQTLAPAIVKNEKYAALAIHIRNGFYVNMMLDRLIGAWKIHSPENKEVLTRKVEYINRTDSKLVKEYSEQLA